MRAISDRSRRAGVLVGLTCLLVTAGFSSIGAPRRLQTQSAPPVWNDAIRTCVGAGRSLDVLFLVDESASLAKTDPDNLRVEAVKAALLIMANGQAGHDRGSGIEVGMAGFGVGVQRHVPFQPLTSASVAGLLDAAEGFRQRSRELDTDYYAALQGAQSWLAERAAGAERPPCQMIIWFTDGQYDIEDRVGKASSLAASKQPDPSIDLTERGAGDRLEARGREELCRPAGIVDQLRASGTPLVEVGLNTEASPFDDAYLRSIVGGTCGSESPLGALVPALRIEEVVLALGEVAAGVSFGTNVAPPEPSPVCEDASCDEGRIRFQVGPAVGRFTILAVPDEPAELSVTAPGTDVAFRVTRTDSGRHQPFGDATVDTTWISDRIFLTTIDLPPAGVGRVMRGEWTATYVGELGSSASSSIQVFADFAIDLKVKEPVPRGEPVDATVSVQSQTIAGPSSIAPGDITVSANLVGGGAAPVRVPVSPRPDGSFDATLTIGEDVVGEAAQIDVRVETESGGVRLPPTVKRFEVAVAPAASGAPPIKTAMLDFGGVNDRERAKAVLAVAESPAGAWCIEIGEPRFPKTVGLAARPSFEAPDECVEIPKDKPLLVPVSLGADEPADLAARGELPFVLRAGDDEVAGSVPLHISFNRTQDFPDPGLAAGLLIGGIGVPLLGMWFVTSITGRYRRPGELHVAELAVLIDEQGVHNFDGGAVGLDLNDFMPVAASLTGNARSFDVGASRFAIRAPRHPFDVAVGRCARDGYASAGPDGTQGAFALVPLALRGAWVLHVDQTGVRWSEDAISGVRYQAQGILLVFVRMGDDTEADLAAVRRQLGEDVQPAARRLAESAASGGDDQEDGMPASAGRTPRYFDGDDAPGDSGPAPSMFL